MRNRLFLLALAAGLMATSSHAAALYSGDARTTTATGTTKDPFAFRVDGNKVIGTIFSNAFSRRIPVRGTVKPSGLFRIPVSHAGISGFVAGKVTAARIVGAGKLRGDKAGNATLRLKATVQAPAANGAPDITGECEFPGVGDHGKPEFGTCYLKFSRNPDGRNYNYTVQFRHYWYRDQTFTINGTFPIPGSMNFSFSSNFGPQQHSFVASFSPVSSTQVKITVNSKGPSQVGVWMTKYEGFYTVKP